MNLFPVNGAAVNGQAYETIYLEGGIDASVAFGGTGIVGKMLAGPVNVALTNTATMSAGINGAGSMAMAFTGGFVPYLKLYPQGQIAVALSTQAAASTGKMLDGSMPIVLSTGADLLRRAVGAGNILIDPSFAADMKVAARIFMDGDITVEVGGSTVAYLRKMAGGALAMTMTTVFDGTAGRTAVGHIGAQLDAALAPSVRIHVQGNIGVSLSAQMDLLRKAFAQGAITVALDTAMNGIRGAMLAGPVNIELDGATIGYVRRMAGGAISIDLTTAFDLIAGRPISGHSDIVLDTSLVPSVRIHMQGGIGIDLSVQMDLLRRAMGSGDVLITLDAVMDGIRGAMFDGVIGIELDPAFLDGRRTAAHRPDFPLEMFVGLDGRANLNLAAGGDISIVLPLSGDLRTGERVRLAGLAGIEFDTSMQGRRYALVPIEGGTAFELVLAQDGVGKPVIPADFSRAPRDRTFRVGPDSRLMRTHSNRRLN